MNIAVVTRPAPDVAERHLAARALKEVGAERGRRASGSRLRIGFRATCPSYWHITLMSTRMSAIAPSTFGFQATRSMRIASELSTVDLSDPIITVKLSIAAVSASITAATSSSDAGS
jgi:hypothetical protein